MRRYYMAQDKDKSSLNWVPDYISLTICMKKEMCSVMEGIACVHKY